MSASQGARARIRAEITREIIEAARQELAAEGAPGLSLRAVARRLDMVPSALYRYFPSRDALLTALIVDSYQGVGAAAGAADGEAGGEPAQRWMAVAHAMRAWARAHPHEWALLYGSPVPGYQAPADTVAAAVEVIEVVSAIIADANPAGHPAPSWLPPAPDSLAAVVGPVESSLLPGRPPEVVAGALMAWSQLVGTVSLELFGHFVGATTDFDPVFIYMMSALGRLLVLGSGAGNGATDSRDKKTQAM
jgi:AcrR family transcriptional regulator